MFCPQSCHKHEANKNMKGNSAGQQQVTTACTPRGKGGQEVVTAEEKEEITKETEKQKNAAS